MLIFSLLVEQAKSTPYFAVQSVLDVHTQTELVQRPDAHSPFLKHVSSTALADSITHLPRGLPAQTVGEAQASSFEQRSPTPFFASQRLPGFLQ